MNPLYIPEEPEDQDIPCPVKILIKLVSYVIVFLVLSAIAPLINLFFIEMVTQ